MRPVDLDYQRQTSPTAVVGVAILLVGLAGAIGVTWHHWQLNEQSSALEARLARTERRVQQQPTVVDRSRDKEMQQAIQRASSVVRELDAPWEDLFRALENSKTDTVALLAVEPDAEKGVVRIVAEAKKREAMLDYVQRLEQEAVLQDVFLTEHQIQQQAPEKPIRFSLSAVWARKS